MKNRIILHNVKKNIPKTKVIQKRPISKTTKPILRKKFYKNQLIMLQNKALMNRKITGVGANINPIHIQTQVQNTPTKQHNQNNQVINPIKKESISNLNNNEIHTIFNKIITTLNNKMNNSEFTNDEDLLLMTYFDELTDLKKQILKLY